MHSLAIYSIALFLTLGCGMGIDLPKHDSRFNPIISQFEKDMEFFGIRGSAENVIVSFGDLDETIDAFNLIPLTRSPEVKVDGACYTVGRSQSKMLDPISKLFTGDKFGKRVVIIDTIHEDAGLEFLESLLYHELGHCSLNYEHDDNVDSVMHEYGIHSLNVSRFVTLRNFFKKVSLDEPVTISPQINDETQLSTIYEVDYEAFGERSFYRFLYDPQSREYRSQTIYEQI
ncbi:MAG: hypothetical protein KC478_15355 [Bacteriovoracaceae bacterium]|nr:hypothetical protein [Bacteriovoracaceae bacterium]